MIDRSIYMVDHVSDWVSDDFVPTDQIDMTAGAPSTDVQKRAKRYYLDRSKYPNDESNGLIRTVAPILPGRYCVIGPSEQTLFGRRDDNDATKTRSILLTPNGDPRTDTNNPYVKVLNTVSADGMNITPTPANTPDSANNIPPATAIVIDSPRRLSITEPRPDEKWPWMPGTHPRWGYYPDYPAGQSEYIEGATGSVEDETEPDVPLDIRRFKDDKDDNPDTDHPLWPIMVDGTTADFRVLHLQRLANPLIVWNRTRTPISPSTACRSTCTRSGATRTTLDPIDSTINAPGAAVPTPSYKFVSHQRGRRNFLESQNASFTNQDPWANNLWRSEMLLSGQPDNRFPNLIATSQKTTDVKHYFNYELTNSFGRTIPAMDWQTNTAGRTKYTLSMVVLGQPAARQSSRVATGAGCRPVTVPENFQHVGRA